MGIKDRAKVACQIRGTDRVVHKWWWVKRLAPEDVSHREGSQIPSQDTRLKCKRNETMRILGRKGGFFKINFQREVFISKTTTQRP